MKNLVDLSVVGYMPRQFICQMFNVNLYSAFSQKNL